MLFVSLYSLRVCKERLWGCLREAHNGSLRCPNPCLTEGQTGPGASLAVAFVRKASCFCLCRVRRVCAGSQRWEAAEEGFIISSSMKEPTQQQEALLMAAPALGVFGELNMWNATGLRGTKTNEGLFRWKSPIVRTFPRMGNLWCLQNNITSAEGVVERTSGLTLISPYLVFGIREPKQTTRRWAVPSWIPSLGFDLIALTVWSVLSCPILLNLIHSWNFSDVFHNFGSATVIATLEASHTSKLDDTVLSCGRAVIIRSLYIIIGIKKKENLFWFHAVMHASVKTVHLHSSLSLPALLTTRMTTTFVKTVAGCMWARCSGAFVMNVNWKIRS